MANIWSVYHEGEDHGGLPWAGIWAVGDLLTDGNHPWGRTNAWAYDGAIYGYREFQALGASNYWLLGQRMYVTNPTAELDATYLAELATLNAGCNYDWNADEGHVMYPTANDNGDGTMTLSSASPGGDTTAFIKCSMAVWGIVRDILTFNSPGPADELLGTAYGAISGAATMTVTVPSPAASALWAVWANEVIALWTA